MFHLLCTVGTKPGFTLEASPVLRDTFYVLHYSTFFFWILGTNDRMQAKFCSSVQDLYHLRCLYLVMPARSFDHSNRNFSELQFHHQ